MKKILCLLLACVLLLAGCSSGIYKTPEAIEGEKTFTENRERVLSATRFWTSEKIESFRVEGIGCSMAPRFGETTDEELILRWAKWLKNLDTAFLPSDYSRINGSVCWTPTFVVDGEEISFTIVQKCYIPISDDASMTIRNEEEAWDEFAQLLQDMGISLPDD